MRLIRLTLLSCLMLLSAASVLAQDADLEERERQEAELARKFEDGMAAIVADLNAGSFEKLVRAIDRDDMLERFLELRLIDPRVKRDFRDELDDEKKFARFIEAAYRNESEDGMKARLLVVESRGDRGRAVVRFDLPYFQVNYLEYDLRIGSWNRIEVLDWKNYLTGYSFSDYVGFTLVQGQPNKNAVRKLIDFPNVREVQVFQVIEVLKASRDRDFERFFNIFDDLDPALKRQRFVLVSGLNATRSARKRRDQRKILVAIDEYHPNDPMLALSLLDYYFPAKKYDKSLAALTRVQKALRIDEAVMNARLSATHLVMRNVDEAVRLADKAVQQEPDLELGWWSLLRAQVAAANFAAAVPALDTLRRNFGHALDAEALSKDPGLSAFVRSQEYRDWFASNPVAAAE